MSHDSIHGTEHCREIFARLSAHLDGELTPEARRELEEHLCGCPPCVEFVESLRRTVDLCHQFEPEAKPSSMTAEARDRLLAACRKMLAARRPEAGL